MKSHKSKNTVTIHIKKSDDKEGRWISLSRFQFEALIVLIPASFLSGIVAIGVLMFDTTQKPVSTSPAQEARNAAVVKWQSGHQSAVHQSELHQSAVHQSAVHQSADGTAANADSYVEGMAVASSPMEPGHGEQKGSAAAEINPNSETSQKVIPKAHGQVEGQLEEGTMDSSAAVVQAESSEEIKPVSAVTNREEASQLKASDKAPNSTPGIEMAGSSLGISRPSESLKKESSPVFSVTQSIKVDDLYNVSTTIFQSKGSGVVSVRIGMKNLTGFTESGRIWAKVLVSSGEEEQWLSSHVNLAANDSVTVKEGTFGKKYLFDSWIERELTLGKTRFQVREVKEIILGAETEKHGQKVAKVDLRGSSDNQSGM